MLLHLDTAGHGEHSTKLSGGHKHCYDDQWPLTVCYFNSDWILKRMGMTKPNEEQMIKHENINYRTCNFNEK